MRNENACLLYGTRAVKGNERANDQRYPGVRSLRKDSRGKYTCIMITICKQQQTLHSTNEQVPDRDVPCASDPFGGLLLAVFFMKL